MNKEIVKVIPDCIEKIGKIKPARLREIKEIISYALPFSVLSGTIYFIHKERMVNKQYKHEETMLEMKNSYKERILEIKHEERMLEIKAKLLSREEERKNEKDN